MKYVPNYSQLSAKIFILGEMGNASLLFKFFLKNANNSHKLVYRIDMGVMSPWQHGGQFTAVPGWNLSGKNPPDLLANYLVCLALQIVNKAKDFLGHEAKIIKNSITYHEIEYLGQIDEPRAWMLLW